MLPRSVGTTFRVVFASVACGLVLIAAPGCSILGQDQPPRDTWKLEPDPNGPISLTLEDNNVARLGNLPALGEGGCLQEGFMEATARSSELELEWRVAGRGQILLTGDGIEILVEANLGFGTPDWNVLYFPTCWPVANGRGAEMYRTDP